MLSLFYTLLSLLSFLCLHQSSGNSFQQWVPELFPCLSYSNSWLTLSSSVTESKSKLCYNWWSVSQSALVSGTHLGPMTRFSITIRQLQVCLYVVPPLYREGGSIVYNCFWASPAQSFSGLSPAGLMTMFYSLKLETPPTQRARIHIYILQEQGGQVIPPGTNISAWTT
jgi:hypothetical protein